MWLESRFELLKKIKIFLLGILLGTSIGVLSGCHSTIQEVCQKEYPAFVSDLGRVQTLLAGSEFREKFAVNKESDERGRRPATGEPYIEVIPDAREDWADWGLDHVHRIQEFMDVIEVDHRLREARKKMGKVANELVLFYGYAEKGDLLKMQEALGKASEYTQGLNKEICI